MVGILEFIGIDVFLAVDVGGVTAAETSDSVWALLIGGLGLGVHESAAQMDTVVKLVDRTHHDLAEVGKAFAHTIALVVVLNIGTGLLAFDLLEQDATAAEEDLVAVFGKQAKVTAGSKSADHHRALHELEVTGRGIA